MHHDIQKLISYHNFFLFFAICKWKEFKLFQLLESFKKMCRCTIHLLRNLWFRMVWWSSNSGHPWWMCLSWRNIFWWRWYGLQWCSTIWFWTFSHRWDNYCCDCNHMLWRVLLLWQKSFRICEKIIPTSCKIYWKTDCSLCKNFEWCATVNE